VLANKEYILYELIKVSNEFITLGLMAIRRMLSLTGLFTGFGLCPGMDDPALEEQCAIHSVDSTNYLKCLHHISSTVFQ
jgi:hypothetical protein